MGLTCSLADHAAPIVALHSAGVINWNSSRFDDMEITREMVEDWCGEIVALAATDCGIVRDDRAWEDACAEAEDDHAPSLAERRIAIERGLTSCEAHAALAQRCRAREVASEDDARLYVRVTRNEVEAFYERGPGMEDGIDSDPEGIAEMAVELVERLARARR